MGFIKERSRIWTYLSVFRPTKVSSSKRDLSQNSWSWRYVRTLEIIFVHHSDFIYEGVEPGSDTECPLQSFPIHHLPHEFAGSACVDMCGRRPRTSSGHPLSPTEGAHSDWLKRCDTPQWRFSFGHSGWVGWLTDHQHTGSLWGPTYQNSRRSNSHQATQWRCSYKGHTMAEAAEDAAGTGGRGGLVEGSTLALLSLKNE